MPKTITIGKSIILRNDIAFVEIYEPANSKALQTTRHFEARVVWLDRDSTLIEDTVEDFAEAHRFKLLPHDRAALNPAVPFRIEIFSACDGFTPSKPYTTRLRWRDHGGIDQCKLLITAPEKVLDLLVDEGSELRAPPRARRSMRYQRKRRRFRPTPSLRQN